MPRSLVRTLGLALASLLVGAPAPAAFAQAGAAPDPPARRKFVRVPAPDGIQIRRSNQTQGQKPGREDRVVVHYHGTLKDGTVFDSSMERGQPAAFRLDKVIPCWTEAVTRLRVGEKAEIICPYDTAYGAAGSPPTIPPKARLTFEIELIGIQ